MRRRAVLTVATLLVAASAPAVASANDGVVLQSAFGGPIVGNSRVCTAEPRALIYGTKNYSAGQPLNYDSEGFPNSEDYYGYYGPANAPSTLDLIPNLQAGARTDLCVGFTLPPDVEEPMVRTLDHLDRPRLQDAVAWPDLNETHVSAVPSTDPQPVGDDLEQAAIDLPAGFTADLATAPQCPQASFGQANYLTPSCATSTQVGDALLRLSTYTTAIKHLVAPSAKVYNLAHGPDELALLGVVAAPGASLAPTKLLLRVTLSGANSSRLRAVLSAVPRTTYLTAGIAKVGSVWAVGDTITDPADPRIGQPLPGAAAKQLYLESIGLRAWGSKTDHPTLATDFAASATRCGLDRFADVSTGTYGAVTSHRTADPFQLNDCDTLSFAPWSTITADQPRPSAPTGLELAFGINQPASGRSAAQLASVNAALPAGMEITSRLLSKTAAPQLCDSAAFAPASLAAAACPAGARVGDVTLNASLLAAPWTGSVYFGTPDGAGQLPKLLIDAAPGATTAPDAPRVKFSGQLWQGDDGTVNVKFADLPQLSLTSVRLTFPAGPGALFQTPPACGTHTATSTFSTGAEGSAVPVASSFTMPDPCDTVAFAPSLSVEASSQPGGVVITVQRPDRSPVLRDAAIQLPSGFLANWGLPAQCALAAASADACPAETRLASVTLLIGAGDHPDTLSGAMYLLDRAASGLARAAVVIPVHDGATDAGTIVFAADMDLSADHSAMTLTTAVPVRANGVALNLRSLSIDFNRPGLMLSPTACGPLSASAHVSSVADGSADPAASLTPSGCGARGFAPALTAALSGTTGAGQHPTARVVIAPRSGDANLRSATVQFPAGVNIDPAKTANRCDASSFARASCPEASRIGTAGAQLSVAPEGISGGLYLVKVDGQALPALGLNLTGRYGQRILAPLRAGTGGRLTATLPDLPDVPFSPVALVIDGGSGGALLMSGSCAAATGWNATFGGQGGQTASASVATACAGPSAGPPPHLELSLKRKTGIKVKLTDFGGLKLQSMKLTLPSSVRFKTATARRKGNAPTALIGGKAKPSFSSSSLTLRITEGAPVEVVVRVRPNAYRVGKHKTKRVPVRLRLSFVDGSVQTRTVSVLLP